MPIENFPRDFSFDESNRSVYEQLTDKTQTLSPFRSRQFSEVFLFAMAIGFRIGRRVPLEGKPSKNIPYSTLKDREWLLKAIAIAETKGLDIMLDKPKIARLAEEYANGGLDTLKEFVFGSLPGDAGKRLEAELRDQLATA